MKRLGSGSLVLALAMIVLTAVGCCKKEKDQIIALHAQYNDLSSQNKNLQGQLAQAKAREVELLSQADTKDLQLASKDQEIAELKAKPVPIVGTGGLREGWDVGRFADRVTVGSDILFASGRATLTAKGKAALNKIVGDLKGNYAGMPVRVYGYTDSDPIKRSKNLWQDNLDLSANRAMAVTRHLLGKGIDAETVETVAMGATHFVAKNNSQTTKARNRRVEIVVLKK